KIPPAGRLRQLCLANCLTRFCVYYYFYKIKCNLFNNVEFSTTKQCDLETDQDNPGPGLPPFSGTAPRIISVNASSRRFSARTQQCRDDQDCGQQSPTTPVSVWLPSRESRESNLVSSRSLILSISSPRFTTGDVPDELCPLSSTKFIVRHSLLP